MLVVSSLSHSVSFMIHPDQLMYTLQRSLKNTQECTINQNRPWIYTVETQEIILHRLNPRRQPVVPAQLLDIEQVSECTLLGLVISSSLSFC